MNYIYFLCYVDIQVMCVADFCTIQRAGPKSSSSNSTRNAGFKQVSLNLLLGKLKS